MATSLISFCKRELIITKSLIQSNAPAIMVTIMCPLIGRLLLVPESFETTTVTIINTLVTWFALCYLFDTANQSFSVDEDKLNKPKRPVPSGLLTIDGLRLRYALGILLGPLIMGKLYGYDMFFWISTWIISAFLGYAWPRTNFHWSMKSLHVGHLTLCILRCGNAVCKDVKAEWDVPILYDLIICTWVTIAIPVQDFFDTEGDRAIGRKTLPICLSSEGIKKVRWFLATFVISASLIILYLTSHLFAYNNTAIYLLNFGHIITSMLLGVRVVQGGDQKREATTYFYYFYYSFFSFIVETTYIGLFLNYFHNKRASNFL